MCLKKRGYVFEKEGYVLEKEGVCVRKRGMCEKEGVTGGMCLINKCL